MPGWPGTIVNSSVQTEVGPDAALHGCDSATSLAHPGPCGGHQSSAHWPPDALAGSAAQHVPAHSLSAEKIFIHMLTM